MEDRAKLVVFDDDLEAGDPGFVPFEDNLVQYVAGLPYKDDGWDDKKIFIVNKHLYSAAQFYYTYKGASYLKVYQGLVAALSLLTIYMNA